MVLPGLGTEFTDTWVLPDDLDDELDDWDAGRFQLWAGTYVLDWLDEAQSRRIADEAFGYPGPDRHGTG